MFFIYWNALSLKIMAMGLILSILILLAIILLIAKSTFFKADGIPTSIFIAAFTLKVLAMIFLWWIYTIYYSDVEKADIYKYFHDAVVMKEDFGTNHLLLLEALNPWNTPTAEFTEAIQNTMHWDQSTTFIQNDNRTMIRLNLILLYLSNGYFHFHALIFTFLSFLGSVALLHFFRRITAISPKLLFLSIFLIPSLLLWTSSTLKESWLFFNLGFFLYFLDHFSQTKSTKHLFLTLLFALTLISIKAYIFIALIPALFFILFKNISKLSVKKSFLISHFILFVAVLTFRGEKLLFLFQKRLIAFNENAIAQNAGSYFKMPIYENWLDFFNLIPMGLYNVFIRPIFPSTLNFLSLLSCIESLFLILLPLLIIRYYKKLQERQLLISFALFSFVLCFAIIVGMTTNVLGAIVRYKVPLIPFYLVAILTFVKVKEVPFLKKLK